MENASKALIIAGAILLAILIISLGIMIFNQASGVVNNNAMDEVEISTFNQKFTQYEGTNVKGAQVNSLLDQIVQNNVSTQSDKSKEVALKAGTGGLAEDTNWQGTSIGANSEIKPTTSTAAGRAMTGKTYTVVCSTNSKTGLVNTITITEVK